MSGKAAHQRSCSRTASLSSGGVMGSINVFGSGPSRVTPRSRTIQRSSTQSAP